MKNLTPHQLAECGMPIVRAIVLTHKQAGYSKEQTLAASTYFLGVLYRQWGVQIDFTQPIFKELPAFEQGFEHGLGWSTSDRKI